jgi:hypothetical protein
MFLIVKYIDAALSDYRLILDGSFSALVFKRLEGK